MGHHFSYTMEFEMRREENGNHVHVAGEHFSELLVCYSELRFL